MSLGFEREEGRRVSSLCGEHHLLCGEQIDSRNHLQLPGPLLAQMNV